MKTKFDGKNVYTYGLLSLEDLLNLRSRFDEEKTDIMTNKAAIVFFRLFLPCAGSKINSTRQMMVKSISNVFTFSQEGYFLIELINNWDRWMFLAWKTHDPTFDEEEQKKYILMKVPRYTNSRFYSSMDGWSADGILKYNELCNSIAKERASGNRCNSMESWFRNWIQNLNDDKSDDQKKAMDEVRVNPYYDSWESYPITNFEAV